MKKKSSNWESDTESSDHKDYDCFEVRSFSCGKNLITVRLKQSALGVTYCIVHIISNIFNIVKTGSTILSGIYSMSSF